MKSIDKKKIKAVLILEIIGRPKEYLIESISEIIKKIDEEKGVAVIEKKVNEPVLIKEQKDLYTTFAEIVVEVEEVFYLAVLMFKYMPAHIQVISPEESEISNTDLTDLFSELCRRLHSYDEITRVLSIEKNILEKKLKSISERNDSPNLKTEVIVSKKPRVKKEKDDKTEDKKEEKDEQ